MISRVRHQPHQAYASSLIRCLRGRLLHQARLEERLLQIARLMHLDDDVAAADELALKEQLWDCWPRAEWRERGGVVNTCELESGWGRESGLLLGHSDGQKGRKSGERQDSVRKSFVRAAPSRRRSQKWDMDNRKNCTE